MSGRIETKTPMFCRYCGKTGFDLRRCASCKEACYCCKSHQVSHWKRVHKKACQHITDNPLSIWVEIGIGDGSGIENSMVQHIFANKNDGFEYVKAQDEFANDQTSRPLRSPYCELLGWDVEMYCSTLFNSIQPHLSGVSEAKGNGDIPNINAAGIYLGCDIASGITRHPDLEGRIFVTGRNQTGTTMTVDVLWGILNFIWDSMTLYASMEDGSGDTQTLLKWLGQYHQGIWQPRNVKANDTKRSNIDLYCTVAENCRAQESTIDHTIPRRG